ncbi:hypothetical protein CCR81_12550 [Halorhodospira halophila]|nr:hypothetical protein [Halorhodospira halophila]
MSAEFLDGVVEGQSGFPFSGEEFYTLVVELDPCGSEGFYHPSAKQCGGPGRQLTVDAAYAPGVVVVTGAHAEAGIGASHTCDLEEECGIRPEPLWVTFSQENHR